MSRKYRPLPDPLSHVLTEQPAELESLLSSVLPGCAHRNVFIVERRDDDVWKNINHATRRLGCDFKSEPLYVRHHIEALLPTIDSSSHLRTRWMLLSHPERPTTAHVAGRYFEAWRTQDLESIRDVFTADATYSYNPFEPALRGRDEIAEYWRREVLTQHNATIEPHTLAVTGNEAIFEWTASFEREGLTVTLRGMMVIRIDPTQARIVELRECYRSIKLPVSADTAGP